MTSYSGKIIRKTPVVPTQTSASGVWTVTDAAAATKNNAWPVAGVPDPISRSVRLRSSASAYLNRTFGTPTDNKKFTFSFWMKRGKFGAQQNIFGAYAANTDYTGFYFDANEKLNFTGDKSNANLFGLTTTAVYRDPSAWYHVVAVFDSANATTANRCIIYINGVSQALTGTTVPSGAASYLNANAVAAGIGLVNGVYFDGYLTEFNFIDGQALTPSSFGTTDAFTGAWIPMAYTGTYGANGFYLNFKDNTSTTTLGYDYSGNANNWATNNISLTAGTTYDSMLDVPTPWVGYSATTDTTAVTRGNYCVLNPLDKTSAVTLTNGNLAYSCATGSQGRSTLGSPTTGLWYFEHTLTSTIGLYTPIVVGACTNTKAVTSLNSEALSLWFYTDTSSWQVSKSVNGSQTAINVSGTSYPDNGNTVQIAYDSTNGKVWMGKNNSWIDSSGGITGNPSAGTNPTFTFTAGQSIFPAVFNVGAPYSGVLNCGQNPFTYTPPTGFKTLCTTNLPTPTISLGAQYMAASTYTGTGAAQSIVNSGNNTTATTFQPDFIWFKSRAQAYSNALYDSVRGRSKALISNTTDAEDGNATSTQDLTSFNSNGFSLGTVYFNSPNNSASNPVAWQWKAAGSTVSNTAGSITSTVSANTTAGFSIVTYTGTGSAATVGHGLGVAPSLIIGKKRSSTGSWQTYVSAISNMANGYIVLNGTGGWTSNSTIWNGTAPTSTVFSLGTDTDLNASGATNVAYCFAEVAGYSKAFTYVGNSSTDGAFVYLGFRPRFILHKASSTTSQWMIWDTSRNTYNVLTNAELLANSSAAEGSGSWGTEIDILSNGIKFRGSDNANFNYSGVTYVGFAFAENPFKYSNAR